MQTLSLTRPDDWHLHLRDGAAMAAVLPDTARRFGRAIVMPNLTPPVTTAVQAVAYRERILLALQAGPARGMKFSPLMTLYLTDKTEPAEIDRAIASGVVSAVKYYPAGATTHSESGVTAVEHTFATLARMEAVGLPLLVHGEVSDNDVDIFDRERVFIDRILAPIAARFPGLRIVLEHITTREAAQFVAETPGSIGATITAHHLLHNRNAMLSGGFRPHYYCLPVLKREEHRRALVQAATSGNPKFFLGTDSAPHPRRNKENACGCAGCYTAHAAIELYAEAFEAAGALDRLEAFASFHGADFYGLPRNTDTIRLAKEAWNVPASQPFGGDDELIPLRAGVPLAWKLAQ